MSHLVPPLKLHLYNFEDGQYEESKYVLTSPRSLEACARLDVKPVDLLYKPLSEYQEELLPQDIPLRTIFNIYDEQEQARQTKLQLCRKERSRIIDEEKDGKPKGRNSSTERPSTATCRSARKQKCIKITRSYSDDDLSEEQLQRKRTAWATSLGHKRLTHHELEQRAKELHEESERLRKVLLARRDKSSRQSRSRKPKGSSVINSSTKPRSSSLSNSRCNFNDSLSSRSHSVSRLSSSQVDNIPARDQRIIEIMKAKREEDRALNKLRRKAELAWDKERKMENEARNEAENRRRKLLGEERRKKKSQITRKNPSTDNQILQNEKLKQKNLQWKSSFLQQLHSKEQKLADKKLRDQLKKRVQEKNLELSRMDEMDYLDSLVKKQNKSMVKSEIRRDQLLHHDNQKNFLSSMNDRKLHEVNNNLLNKSLADDLEKSRLMSDLRHSRAKSNHSNMLESQYRSMHVLQEDREMRKEKARQSISKMEEELVAWRKQILKERQKSDKYAENVVHKTNEMKSLRAHNSRLAKQIEQKQNIKRIEADDEAWRWEAKLEMEEKERKADIQQRQKDMAVEQMRATAKVTQNLRDSIRRKYDTDTFDKKVREAEIHANLGRRAQSQARKNMSSVEIC